MKSVEEFLAHAIRLEDEAARRFEQLTSAMESYGNREVASLFRKLAHFSRLHLADARARSGFRDVPRLSAENELWGPGASPEACDDWACDPQIAPVEALSVALEGERRAYEFYRAVSSTSTDPEMRRLAQEFAEEEAEHVCDLEKWIAKTPA